MHTLSVLMFTCIYFCKRKKIVLCEYLFLQMASFWKFHVYKFQPQRKKNTKNTVESRDIRLMFLSRSMERHAGHEKKKLLLWIDSKKAELTYIFWAHFFFSYIYFGKSEFWAYLVYIYFCKCSLKENFVCILFCKIN